MFFGLLANGTTLSYPRSSLGIQDPLQGILSSWLGLSHIYPCGVDADPISLDLVVCWVLVSIMDITKIMSVEVSMHQVIFLFLVTWLVRCRLGHLVTWSVTWQVMWQVRVWSCDLPMVMCLQSSGVMIHDRWHPMLIYNFGCGNAMWPSGNQKSEDAILVH